jgi:hypothetical protein
MGMDTETVHDEHAIAREFPIERAILPGLPVIERHRGDAPGAVLEHEQSPGMGVRLHDFEIGVDFVPLLDSLGSQVKHAQAEEAHDGGRVAQFSLAEARNDISRILHPRGGSRTMSGFRGDGRNHAGVCGARDRRCFRRASRA